MRNNESIHSGLICLQTKEGRKEILQKGEICPIRACILKKREWQIVCLYHAKVLNVCKIMITMFQNFLIFIDTENKKDKF